MCLSAVGPALPSVLLPPDMDQHECPQAQVGNSWLQSLRPALLSAHFLFDLARLCSPFRDLSLSVPFHGAGPFYGAGI